jgi:hypothetical protein
MTHDGAIVSMLGRLGTHDRLFQRILHKSEKTDEGEKRKTPPKRLDLRPSTIIIIIIKVFRMSKIRVSLMILNTDETTEILQ